MVKATKDLLYTRVPQNYRPWGRRPWNNVAGRQTPLAVRLEDGSILANGSSMDFPMHGHQLQLLRTLERSNARFGVVRFHSIVAARTGGKVRDWDESPVPISELKREVAVIVPSAGEQWREVVEKDAHGRERTRSVHTLGDCVVRVLDRFYVSAVDETGHGNGMYFLAELSVAEPPASLEEALNALKPGVVRDAEANGTYVPRQGEWSAVPTKRLRSELLADVVCGLAVYREKHVVGRDGHHELQEAVIYKVGPHKGEVYASGVLRHTKEEHRDLSLGTLRWHLGVHNVAGGFVHLLGARHRTV